MSPTRLLIGIGGTVVALDPATGRELWRRKLKGGDTVTLREEGPYIFAGSRGHLFCLEAANGAILWHNELKGLGYGLVTFPGDDPAAAQHLIEQQSAAAASSNSGVP